MTVRLTLLRTDKVGCGTRLKMRSPKWNLLLKNGFEYPLDFYPNVIKVIWLEYEGIG